MATSDDIKNALAENATGPKRVTSDGQTVEQHDLSDQAAAMKEVASAEAAKNPSRGFRFTKLVSPGGG